MIETLLFFMRIWGKRGVICEIFYHFLGFHGIKFFWWWVINFSMENKKKMGNTSPSYSSFFNFT